MKNTEKMLAAIRPKMRRVARSLARRYRGLLDLDEAQALCDLGALEAWRHRRLDDTGGFASYASSYARGNVLSHVRRELRHRDSELAREARVTGRPEESPEVRVEARRLLDRLTPQERAFLVRHVCGRDSLAELAREAQRHRAWGSRTLARALGELRDSSCPPC